MSCSIAAGVTRRVSTSIAQQKRMIALLGQMLTWVGARMVVWGQALQTTPPK
ncbi:MAG: hypothetical protein R2911_38150 [Caldilineaceae bacterium]